jgi:tyrosine-protein kinase Etk/Wzc
LENNNKTAEELGDDKKNFTLNDFLYVLLKYKKQILIVTISLTVISAFIAFFVLDPIFHSNSIVKASEKSSGLEKLLSGGGLLDIGEFGELAGAGAGANELALFEQIVNSRTCVENFIIKFNLLEEFNYKYMYDCIKYVREEVFDITRNKLSNTMTIGVYYKDPQIAKQMVEFLIDHLNKTYTDLNVLNAKNNREFLEKRYKEAMVVLNKTEDSMKVFQDKYGVSPELKVKAALQTQMQLEATVISEEVKLDMLKKILSSDQPEIKEQENKISSLRNKLQDMKTMPIDESELALNGAPEIIMGYLRLQRELEIQNKILTTLIPLFEQARLQEKKDTPSLLIIDYPNVPDKKAKPKRLIIIGASGFLGFVSVYIYFFFYVFIYSRIRNVRRQVSESIS